MPNQTNQPTNHPTIMKAINSTAKKYYIQRKEQRALETVDQFETRKEARAMRVEYSTADKSAYYYISSRPCAGWNK